MHVNAKDVDNFKNNPVFVCIYGEQSEDQAPWVRRNILKTTLCPDSTHLQIYFDKHFFFAVPLSSKVDMSDHAWTAYDEKARLHYAIKKEVKVDV
ncbi:hypothetical protein [Virgibacillus halodenitrificans]|uniref:hypothetical protein n=1 Tax=Virgibacillus halodenitrificans TaxID=1482 RepID=UPI002DB57872|nr:hypothetical protein [Virgibacillus halodenitrificans]MEC2159237.1 hypothetical protein [Virgibacillus halodenitrificans]